MELHQFLQDHPLPEESDDTAEALDASYDQVFGTILRRPFDAQEVSVNTPDQAGAGLVAEGERVRMGTPSAGQITADRNRPQSHGGGGDPRQCRRRNAMLRHQEENEIEGFLAREQRRIEDSRPSSSAEATPARTTRRRAAVKCASTFHIKATLRHRNAPKRAVSPRAQPSLHAPPNPSIPQPLPPPPRSLTHCSLLETPHCSSLAHWQAG